MKYHSLATVSFFSLPVSIPAADLLAATDPVTWLRFEPGDGIAKAFLALTQLLSRSELDIATRRFVQQVNHAELCFVENEMYWIGRANF